MAGEYSTYLNELKKEQLKTIHRNIKQRLGTQKNNLSRRSISKSLMNFMDYQHLLIDAQRNHQHQPQHDIPKITTKEIMNKGYDLAYMKSLYEVFKNELGGTMNLKTKQSLKNTLLNLYQLNDQLLQIFNPENNISEEDIDKEENASISSESGDISNITG